MICFRNVTKKYGNLSVYSGFSLDIKEGEITCILGESGSGKTTLLNMMARLTEYTGEITPVRKYSYVFQEPRLVQNLTVRGNLKLVCSDDDKISRMISAVELSDKADAYPVTLSGGQARRVSLARAFLYPSDAILMDEPFSSLDLRIKLKIARLFLDLWKAERRTAVFVTHDTDEALMLANRIVVISKGAVRGDFRQEDEPNADLFARNGMRTRLIEAVLKN